MDKLTQRVLDRFDGAGLLTLRKLTSEELELLVDYVNQHRLGARGAVPAARPQHQTKEEEEKHDKRFSQQTKEDKTPFG